MRTTTCSLYITTGMSKKITGSTLKLIAIISMFIDHFAATILERQLVVLQVNGDIDITGEPMYIICTVMRLIGRLAFPIFIFLLVQGFTYTKNRWKYLGRLSLFALISEIPFDMAFVVKGYKVKKGVLLSATYQNVFFTLAIGLLCIMIIDYIRGMEEKSPKQKRVYCVLVTLLGMATAMLLYTDYSFSGVLAIVVAYLLREKPVRATFASIVILVVFSSFSELAAFLILPLIACYNGERGWNIKWLFYLFYPVHLLVLALVCVYGLGI